MLITFTCDRLQNHSVLIVFGLFIAISGNLILKNREVEFAGLALYHRIYWYLAYRGMLVLFDIERPPA
jgi:hypothetical protein